MKTNNFFNALSINNASTHQGGYFSGQATLPGRNKAVVSRKTVSENSYQEDFATALRRELAATPALYKPVSPEENVAVEGRAIQFLKEFWA